MVTERIIYVDTACTSGGTGTTDAIAGVNRAYATLNEAMLAEASDLVTNDERLVFYCAASTGQPDPDRAQIVGFDVDETHFITVTTTAANAISGMYPLEADCKYRMETSNANNVLKVSEAYTVVRGIAVRNTKLDSGGNAGIDIGAYANNAVIDACVVNMPTNTAGANRGIEYYQASGGPTNVVFKNNICYAGGIGNCFYVFGDTGSVALYNNTAILSVASINGIIYRYGDINDNGFEITMKNNIAKLYSTGTCYEQLLYEPVLTSGNNYSSDDTAPDGPPFQNKTFSFWNEGASDYHLDFGNDESGAIGGGVDILSEVATDVDLDVRSTPLDAGADQYPSADPTPRIRYVDTSSAAGGDGTTSGLTGSHRAYNDLSDALAAEKTGQLANLVGSNETLTIYCAATSGVTDAGGANITGFITDSTHFITITTTEANAIDGIYPTGNKYKLERSASNYVLNIDNSYTVVRGIAVKNTRTSTGINAGINIDSDAESCTVDACVVHHGFATTGTNACINYSHSPGGPSNCKIINNVCIGKNTILRIYGGTGSVEIYNNTVVIAVLGGFGGGIEYGDQVGSGFTVTMKNNLVYLRAGTLNCYNQSFTAPSLTSANNFSSDATSPDGASYHGKTYTFIDSPSHNYHLDFESDTSGAVDGGVNLSSIFTGDVDLSLGDRLLPFDAGADGDNITPPVTSSGISGFYFLINDAGIEATSVGMQSEGVQDTNYDEANLITGSRQVWFKTTSTSDEKRIGYVWSGDMDLDHVIITRADKLVTQAGNTVSIQAYNGAWQDVESDIDLNSLVGLKRQDYVLAMNIEDITGIAVLITPDGTEANLINHFVGAQAFTFNREPAFSAIEEEIPPSDMYFTDVNSVPKRFKTYEVSDKIALKFEGVTRDKIDEFLALDNIDNHPFYIYDSAHYLWAHKLEHVILESFRVVQLNDDYWSIAMILRRLKQYD